MQIACAPPPPPGSDNSIRYRLGDESGCGSQRRHDAPKSSETYTLKREYPHATFPTERNDSNFGVGMIAHCALAVPTKIKKKKMMVTLFIVETTKPKVLVVRVYNPNRICPPPRMWR